MRPNYASKTKEGEIPLTFRVSMSKDYRLSRRRFFPTAQYHFVCQFLDSGQGNSEEVENLAVDHEM